MSVGRPVWPVLLLLASCGDPYHRSGTWHPTGINQANFDAEAVDKVDTVAGHGDPGSDALLDTAAAIRLHDDRTKPLRNESTTAGTGTQ